MRVESARAEARSNSDLLREVRTVRYTPQITFKLLTDTAAFDDRTVAFDIVLEKVVEELSSLTDHLLHTSAAVVVLGVLLKVLGELSDSLGKNSDLNLGRTGVAFVNREGLDDVLLVFLCDHGVSPFKKYYLRYKLGKRLVKSGEYAPCVRKPCKSAFQSNIPHKSRFVNTFFQKNNRNLPSLLNIYIFKCHHFFSCLVYVTLCQYVSY